MAQVKPDDVIADVGAFVGYWTVGLARRLGKNGQVLSFEPDMKNFKVLTTLVAINNIRRRVKLFNIALDSERRVRYFHPGNNDLCRIDIVKAIGDIELITDTLDNILFHKHIDIMKIDVEGFEEQVLKGGHDLLLDEKRAPRLICIEVHPHLWRECQYNTTSESLLVFLREQGYKITSLSGKDIDSITDYGHIFASKHIIRN